MAQMASHLLAELFNAQDEYRHGRMTEAGLKARVSAIRRRAAMSKNPSQVFCRRTTVTVVGTISDLTEQWRGIMQTADGLRQQVEAVR